MTVDYRDGVLFAKMPVSLDTTNIHAFEEELDRSFREHEAGAIVFDADEMNYISSAGLRAILKLMKRGITVSMVNVSEYVYEIFDMTGYANLISIERKQEAEKQAETKAEANGQGGNGPEEISDAEPEKAGKTDESLQKNVKEKPQNDE